MSGLEMRVGPFDLNLKGGAWPSQMPALASIILNCQTLCSALPKQLLLHKQLHSLELYKLHSSHLPDWFSGMTQLKSLILTGAELLSFPLCLLPLCQLHYLYLEGLCNALLIPAEIAIISDWDCLEGLR